MLSTRASERQNAIEVPNDDRANARTTFEPIDDVRAELNRMTPAERQLPAILDTDIGPDAELRLLARAEIAGRSAHDRRVRMNHPIVGIALAAAMSLASSTTADAQRERTPPTPRADAFSRVHCGADVAKALIGGTLPNGPTAATEAAHANIELHDVGGSSINDTLFLGGWQICGHEYELLVRNDRVEDALQFPPHSRRQPGFFGACTRRGKPVADVLAVLDNPAPRPKGQSPYAPNDTTSLGAISAWRVDARRSRFAGIATTGLRCPRGSVFTVDGGT